MIHNDVLRSVRYMLDISDNKVVEIIKLGGLDVTKDDIVTYLKKDEEEGFVRCPDNVMAHFLDGLVWTRKPRPPPPSPSPCCSTPHRAWTLTAPCNCSARRP